MFRPDYGITTFMDTEDTLEKRERLHQINMMNNVPKQSPLKGKGEATTGLSMFAILQIGQHYLSNSEEEEEEDLELESEAESADTYSFKYGNQMTSFDRLGIAGGIYDDIPAWSTSELLEGLSAKAVRQLSEEEHGEYETLRKKHDLLGPKGKRSLHDVS